MLVPGKNGKEDNWMTKKEFLDKLRLALNGKVPVDVISDTLNYYEEYINTEIRMGKSEEDVMRLLGDPRLIAKTTIETSGKRENSENRENRGSATYSSYSGASGEEGDNEYGHTVRRFHSSGWIWLVLVLLIVLLVISVAFRIIAFFLPILFPILLVVLLVKLFRDWIA